MTTSSGIIHHPATSLQNEAGVNGTSVPQKLQKYYDFLAEKVEVVDHSGFAVDPGELHPSLFPHQRDVVMWAGRMGRGLIAASFGLGKCHGAGTKILMADGGIKSVEDIHVGDRLMGDDGTSRNVLSLARGREAMYRITLKNGDSYTCNASHIMSLKVSNKYQQHKPGDIVNMSVEDYLKLPDYAKRNCFKHYKVGLEFPEQPVPFDPYLYGAWTINDVDTEISERILEFAEYRDLSIRQGPGRGCTSYFLSRKIRGKASHCQEFHFVQSSAGGSGKRIDGRYLNNSRSIRLQVLAGLIDTDGYLVAKCYEVSTKWRDLRDDILFLCRSLGFSVTHANKVVNGVVYHRIWISGDTHLIPCITRKKAGQRQQIKNPLVYGFEVEPVGGGNYYGFEIDGNHLYLLADFTVTHNTTIEIELARLIHQKKGGISLIVCPLGVKHQFSEEDGPRLGVQFQYVRTDEEIEAATTPYLLTNYERVRDGDIDPRKHNITMASLDEGSVLRSLGSKTYQVFLDAFSNVPHKYICTATPSPNNFKELIYYANYLDIMDYGQSLTRFFQRDTSKAGNLTIHPQHEEKFWLWVASWALFLYKPSDLGYSDEGYDLPELRVHYHRIGVDQTRAWGQVDNRGQHRLFLDAASGVREASAEKRATLDDRVAKMLEIVAQYFCIQTSITERENENTEGTEQGVLRGKQGGGEAEGFELLPPEQRKDRPRKETGVYEGVLENLRTEETDTRAEGGEKQEETGTVCDRPGIQREGEVSGEGVQSSSPWNEKEWTTEIGIWDNPGRVQGDPREARGRLCNLREETDGDKGEGQEREGLIRGPQSRNWSSPGYSLSPLQLRDRPLSGQLGVTLEGGRVLDQLVIWCHLNDEQRAIKSAMEKHGLSVSSIDGSLSVEEGERRLYEWKGKRTCVLLSKPEMLGSGLNLQQCHKVIFAGIDYKFQDFIQAVHRTHRFQQQNPVDVHIIYAESEDQVMETLKRKWRQHDELAERMRQIVQKYGLLHEALSQDLKRSIGIEREEVKGRRFTAVNNDCVAEVIGLPSSYFGAIITSIPFSTHYEYVASYNDFGHNKDDERFLEQMDFLIPELLRVLKPGRTAAIHVKDLIKYGHQTASGFMEVNPFSAKTIFAFTKHGFMYEGEIFITTDVVRENNSTYRLGWSEMCKDGSKMGVGLPEKVLLFRKPPTSKDTAYADQPVVHNKQKYTRARWQVDAHSHWRSDGNRPLLPGELYNYEQHIARLERLENNGNLPATYFVEPPISHSPWVWDDINPMLCLNSEQSQRQKANHTCPLPFDIVRRLVERFTSDPEMVDEPDIILDPFAGLFTVPFIAVEMGRRGYGIELSSEYFSSGVSYCQKAEIKATSPTLFDLMEFEIREAA